MSAVPVGGQVVRPGLKVVRGRRRLPRFAMVPWLAYTMLLALAFLALVYSQTSLNNRAVELDAVRAEVVEAARVGEGLKLEIARLQAPDRVVAKAAELGMRLPDVPLRTLTAETAFGRTDAQVGVADVEAAP
jgi:cell division protein FtsL